MKPWMRVVAGLVLAAAGGLLLVLAYPPVGAWPLVFVAMVPAIVAQHHILPRRWSGLGFGVGFGLYFWLFYGPLFAHTAWFMEWLPLAVFVIASVASSSDRTFHEATGYRWFVLHGAVVWVAVEAIRGLIPMIGTGGFVAYPLWEQTWLLQPVSVFSIYGLSLLIMSINYAVALGILAWLDHRAVAPAPVTGRLARRWAGGVVLASLAWAGLSLALWPADPPGTPVRVAAIQPGAISGAARTQQLYALTRAAAAQGAQIVVWPEGALGAGQWPGETATIQALAWQAGIYLAVGHAIPGAAGWANEVTLFGPDGALLGTYGKDHPVVWAGETSLTRGTYPTYRTPLGTLATIICYDLNFTDTSRRLAAGGAGLIAVASNDSPAIGAQQPSNLVFRAIENRIALVKADTAYDSLIIDPAGRIVRLAATAEPAQTTVLAAVAPGRADAPLIAWGDAPAWAAILGMGLFIIAARRPRARQTAPLPAPDPIASKYPPAYTPDFTVTRYTGSKGSGPRN
jgi:apolipoprotein N-acyltransferase